MAGGKKLPERDALQMTWSAMDRGAAGVDMGRNIFQSDSPIGMIQAVNAIVHGNASVDDAYAVYVDEKARSGITGPGVGCAPTAASSVTADDSRKI
jgi:putative autoinducer-2 (AI-2) aldolase